MPAPRGFLLVVVQFVTVFFCIITIAARDANAQDSPAVVEVVAAGEDETARAFESVVRELLARQPVEIHWSRVAEIDPREVLSRRPAVRGLVARVWADLSDISRARVYVANATSDRFLVRFVPLEEGDDEVVRESIAHIIESAVDALLSGGQIGVSRDVAAAQIGGTVPPAVVPRGCRGSRFEIGAMYQLSLLAPEPTWIHEPGVLALLSGGCEQRLSFTAGFSAQYALPIQWRGSLVSLGMEGLVLRARAGLNVAVTSRIAVQFALGAGVDVIDVQPRAVAGSPVIPSAAFWIVSPMLQPSVLLHAVVASPLALFVGVACDVDLSGQHFDLVTNDSTSPTFSPYRIRPSVLVGFSIALNHLRR